MSTPQAIRQLNERRVLATLFRSSGMSRAELARTLRLTRSTTGYLVQSLIADGVLREKEGAAAESDGRLGRPGILVEIEPNGAFFIGADIGVDRVRAVAVDLSAHVRNEVSCPFSGQGRSPETAARLAAALIRDVLAALPPRCKLHGVSVAIPGFPASDGRSYHASILGWHRVDIAEVLRRELGNGMPVMVENDANAFAFEETYLESQDPTDTLVILIENGVGGGIISGGRIYRGRMRGAGEIGHMRVGEEGYIFDPHRPGRFESYVGKDALLARCAYYGAKYSSMDAVGEAFQQAEAPATRALLDWGTWLARGLATLVSVLEPQRVIIGGSVGVLYDFVADHVEAGVAAALPEGFPMPPIMRSKSNEAGPAIGSAFLLHQAMLSMDGQFAVPA